MNSLCYREMPPTKKHKTIEPKCVEENKAECSKSVLSVTNPKNLPTRLSSLSYDALLCIYKFLSPADIASLSQLDDPKFREMAEFQRELNFSVCWRAGAELLSSFFTRESVKRIQKLNFNAYVFARPCDLVQVICRCKSLVNLSILECGIQYKQILKIIKSCSSLKELSWSVIEPVEIELNVHSSVTKLFLLFDLDSEIASDSCYIFRNFPKIESAIICFSPDALSVPPFHATWSNSFYFTSDDRLRWIVVIGETVKFRLEMIPLQVECLVSEIKDFLQISPSEDTGEVDSESLYYNRPPFLKICANEKISELLSCGSRNFSYVIICLTSASVHFSETLFKYLSEVTGSELKHLTLEYDQYKTDLKIPCEQLLLHQMISDLLGNLLLDCKNITVLNIGSVHFSSGSPLKAMCTLKNLKFLNLPTCAIPKNPPNSATQSIQLEYSSFEELVSKCSKVEDFHLVCCYADKGKMQDSEIFPIKNWKRLISFTIYSVIFTSCHFLKQIADCCQELKFFSYINSARNSGCIFYEDVIYLLKNAKKLSFIRINCENFDPQFERFLDAVSLAENLEGICILTKRQLDNASGFISKIGSLKYLHLFHFEASRVPEVLYTDVRRLMERNNIKNGKVESDCKDNAGYINCCYAETNEFYHIKPPFFCKHLHLKPFLYDSCTYFDSM